MKKYNRILAVFFAVITGLLYGAISTSFASFPGYQNVQGPLITPQEAHQVLISPLTEKDFLLRSKSSTTVTEEIKSLVRGLNNDPDLIYAFVHDHIKYVPIFGDVKGAAATLTDRTGNDFDQASLMITMLREAGFTATYVYGVIRLYPDQVLSWLGTNHPGRLGHLLPSAGIPVQIYAYTAEELAYIDIDHVWVKVNIDGSDYVFDSSFKSHDHYPGLDIKTITGFDKTQFINDALSGSVTGTEWIQNISKNNIQNSLSTMAMNLVNHIRTNIPDASLKEMIGGSEIIKDSTIYRQTSLSYQQSVTQEWSEIPVSFKTSLRIRLPGIDQTLFSSDTYGKRLTIFYNGSNQPELRLDGSLIDTGTAVTPDTNQTISINVNHPYAASDGTYADTSGTINIRAGGSYILVNGWGEISQNMVEKHRKILEQNRYNTGLAMSEPVLGQSLAMLSYLWLAECSRMDDLTEPITNTEIIHHHWIGVSGQNESPYIDMPINLQSVISLDNNEDMKRAVFVNSSGHHSAFEWGIIEQTQPSYSAVSTVKLIDNSNEKSDKIFEADSSNFNTIKTLLKQNTYNTSELSHIQSYINAGYRVILPEDGNLGEGTWEGTGFLTINPAASSVGHIISGGLKGGFGTEIWDIYATDLLTSGQTGQNSNSHEQSPEPIDLVTGNYLYDHTDLTVGSNPAPLGLTFSRSYNSGNHLAKGSPGLGWSHHFEIRADIKSDGFQAMGKDSVIDAASAIAEILASAEILSESVSRNNLVIATIAHRWAMDNMINNMVLFTQPGMSSQFVKLADGSFYGPSNSTDQLLINPDDTIQISKKHGSILMFNTDGTIDYLRDTNNNTINFSYTDNQVSQVSNGTGYNLAFTYTDNLLTMVEDSSFRSVTYGYDATGNLTTYTDAAGETTTFEYVSDGMLSRIFYPTDSLNAFVYNQYDAIGKITSQTDAQNNEYLYGFADCRAIETNPEGKSKIWFFDKSGKTIASIDELGNVTQKKYDPIGRLQKIIQPLLNEKEFEYDVNHNILTIRLNPVPSSLENPIETNFTYDLTFNQALTKTDPLGRIIDYSYDANGNLMRIQFPSEDSIRPETNYIYNSKGQVLTITDPEGKVTQNNYDPITGDLLQVIDDYGGENISAAYTYDAAGNKISATDPNGNTTTLFYNSLGKLTSSISPAPFNYETQLLYDTVGNLVEIKEKDSTLGNQWQSFTAVYSPSFKKQSIADPENDTTLYQYDAVDRLWKITDPENNTSEYIYDAAGRIILKIDANLDLTETYTYTVNGQIASITDGNQNTTILKYDGLDRLMEKEFPDGTKVIYHYDAVGNISQKQTRAGQTISFTYDSLNRLLTKASPYKTIDYTYDRAGKLLTATDSELTLSYEYDSASRFINVTRSDEKSIEKQYDKTGNIVKLTYPDGYYITYTYDTMNRLNQILESGTTPLVDYSYDSLSRRSNINYGNGTITSFGYEPDNDVSSILYQFNSKNVTFNYEYNKIGNKISFSSTDDRFLYQPLADNTINYTANNLNQYTDINSTLITHDLNGNLISDNTNTYAYDPENHLKQVVTFSDTIIYASDPMGRRSNKTIGSIKTDYVYAGGDVMVEYDNTNTMTKRFIYGPGIDEPVCMITPLGKYFYHADALGSISALSDSTGDLEKTYAYSPFGKTNNTGTHDNPYLFTGRRGDPESGLYYYRARHYDAESGRFMQPDPICFDGGINLYAYVLNNPLNFIDPDGRKWVCGPTADWGPGHSFGFGFGESHGFSLGLSGGASAMVGASLNIGAMFSTTDPVAVSPVDIGPQAGVSVIGLGVGAGVSTGYSLGYSYGGGAGWFCGWVPDDPPTKDKKESTTTEKQK